MAFCGDNELWQDLWHDSIQIAFDQFDDIRFVQEIKTSFSNLKIRIKAIQRESVANNLFLMMSMNLFS